MLDFVLTYLQVVYVAPMKALAAEVTANFGKRLAPLGLLVRELTGGREVAYLCVLFAMEYVADST